MTDVKQLYDAVLNGNSKTAAAVTKDALSSGNDPMDLAIRQMIPAMDEVGRRFESEEYFVPELLLSARAMKASMKLLLPLRRAWCEAGWKGRVRFCHFQVAHPDADRSGPGAENTFQMGGDCAEGDRESAKSMPENGRIETRGRILHGSWQYSSIAYSDVLSPDRSHMPRGFS